MVKVLFRVDDQVVTVEGAPGDSIMQVATQHQLPRIDGECGGELSCATCHVYLEEPQGFSPASEEEEDLLELAEDRTDASRLGCQLTLRDTMTEIEVTVP
ncbi:2Fe-2S iron-sulfur cluster-binding protein [Rhodococcoides yunnanense]|uniref:2Fe-2S iron-sulfur cluster-binding protein n=1 Tax=Rhodococcoides yunnanense TaxID=278209 RepID=UPI0009344A94|nr:2Fe-2S iron-sulfur cluster-binding protein [Rhodococcus yunnanensis]